MIFTAPSLAVTVIITVPEGVAIRMDAIGFMGGTAGPADIAPPGAPSIRITGLAVMGGIEVKRPKSKGSKAISASTRTGSASMPGCLLC